MWAIAQFSANTLGNYERVWPVQSQCQNSAFRVKIEHRCEYESIERFCNALKQNFIDPHEYTHSECVFTYGSKCVCIWFLCKLCHYIPYSICVCTSKDFFMFTNIHEMCVYSNGKTRRNDMRWDKTRLDELTLCVIIQVNACLFAEVHRNEFGSEGLLWIEMWCYLLQWFQINRNYGFIAQQLFCLEFIIYSYILCWVN